MPTTTNNMGLKIPIAGETDYATSVSDSFTAIDGHDHSSSEGVQIPTAGIENLAVTTGKLAANVLSADSTGRGKMQDGFLSANAEGRAKMADGFLTQAKRAALGQQLSSSSASFAGNTPGSAQDVTNLSVSITTTGRPVFVGLISDGSTSNSQITLQGTSTDIAADILIVKDSTVIAKYTIGIADAVSNAKIAYAMPHSVATIDIPSAGTYTYKIQYQLPISPAMDISFANIKLIAYEL